MSDMISPRKAEAMKGMKPTKCCVKLNCGGAVHKKMGGSMKKMQRGGCVKA